MKLYDVHPVRELLKKHGPDGFLSDEVCDVGKLYRAELAMVQTAKQLRVFVDRWRVLYKLADLKPQRRFNVSRVHRKRLLLEGPKANYKPRGDSCAIAMDIILPYPILQSLMVAQRFQVTPNVAMVQLYNAEGGEFF